MRMKCKNCGSTEFVMFAGRMECACCGAPMSEERPPICAKTKENDLNGRAIALFEEGRWEEAFRLLDAPDVLPAETENLVYYGIHLCFLHGRGTPIDFERAYYFWKRAQDAGPFGSDEHLGVCFFRMGKDAFLAEYRHHIGKRPWTEADRTFYIGCAHELLERAAGYGNADALAYLGLCRLYGICVPADDAMALSYFRASSEQGSAEGAFRLGSCLERGIGAAADLPAALCAYERAARCGDARAKDAIRSLRK